MNRAKTEKEDEDDNLICVGIFCHICTKVLGFFFLWLTAERSGVLVLHLSIGWLGFTCGQHLRISGVDGWRMKDAGRRMKDGWRTEDRGWRTEDGRWRTEDGAARSRNLENALSARTPTFRATVAAWCLPRRP
jgi:hypothetical protein